MWKEVYLSLIKYKNNLTLCDTWTILLYPLRGEDQITSKNTTYTEELAQGLQLIDILAKN